MHGDTALVFKMVGLYEVMKEEEKPGEEAAFLLEHPSDPWKRLKRRIILQSGIGRS